MDIKNTPQEQTEEMVHCVRSVTWWGLLVNLLLTAAKFVAGILGNSQAVVADAVHTVSDMATDVMVLVGVRYWTAPADSKHPYGHRRIETAITLALGTALAGVGIGIGYQALSTIREGHIARPEWIAFGAAVLSIVSKEILYRWTARVGRRLASDAVVANAWHHRSDALSSIPAALAVAVAAEFPDWEFVDHVGAVVVAVFILQAAWSIVGPSLARLVDIGAPDATQQAVRGVALTHPNVRWIHAVRTRYLGSGLHVDLHVQVDSEMTVREGHQITEEVKTMLMSVGPDVVDVVIHLEPFDDAASV
jgi:cation diffusion facilitator family transporter